MNIYVYITDTLTKETLLQNPLFNYHSQNILTFKQNDYIDILDMLQTDLNIPLHALVTNSYQLNSQSLNNFFVTKKESIYNTNDYAWYCLTFNDDYYFINQVILKLISLSSELLTTLKTYLHNNGNVLKSSRDLFLHRNSMLYRLHKIETMLALDIFANTTIFTLAYLITYL